MDYIQIPGNHLVQFGDILVIYVSEIHRYIFKVEPGAEIQTKRGQIKAEELVGHKYGIKFEGKRGWVLPLRLTPELWTQLLPHRTQILYQADIGMILLQLDIKPGSVIVESGTGSGSLSHALIRACRPSGFLHTFEINQSRAEEARKEFTNHGYGQHVRVERRNVCEFGFGDDLIGKADACMLDLPQTWSAIEHAYKILKPYGSRLCTFSPCVEQVQHNVAKMTELKMKDIVTLETLLLPREIKSKELRFWEEEVLDGLTAIDKRRFKNLEDSLKAEHKRADPKGLVEPNVEQAGDNEPPPGDDDQRDALQKALTDPKAPFLSHMLPKKGYTYARNPNESVSHSGFLTFATKWS